MDAQKEIMQNLWRKAGGQSEALEIRCATLADARRVRFALYNAVREFKERDGKPGKTPDAALGRALDACMVSFAEGDGKVVVIRQKVAAGFLQAAQAALGATPQASREDLEASASLAGVLKRLGGDVPEAVVPAHRATPYYSR